MKKSVYVLSLLFTLLIAFSGCREDKTAGEKVKEGIEEVGEGIEEGAEEVGDEIEDAADEVEDAVDDTP